MEWQSQILCLNVGGCKIYRDHHVSEPSEKIEKVIQFLVSPQNDFVKRIENDKQRPNDLHVGFEAVTKMRGRSGEPDPFVDTVKKFFEDDIPGTEKLHIILDEDWHSKNDKEWEDWKPHCIKGTEGAALPEELQEFRFHPRCDSIQANNVDISLDDRFQPTIEKYCGNAKPERIRAGIIGVWTHIKVKKLLESLNRVYPKLDFSNIGICEPLCTSPNKEDHDQAIKNFKEVYKANVYSDCDEYCRHWLGLKF